MSIIVMFLAAASLAFAADRLPLQSTDGLVSHDSNTHSPSLGGFAVSTRIDVSVSKSVADFR